MATTAIAVVSALAGFTAGCFAMAVILGWFTPRG